MSVRIGAAAPVLALDAYVRGQSGPRRIDLADLRGSWVVLVFYPRDCTDVCPTELHAFAELDDEFEAVGAVVLAASSDSYHAHRARFEVDSRPRDESFPVLADTARELSAAYGVLAADGDVRRATFLIDPDGIVRHLQINDLDGGRDPREMLRLVFAFQTRALCPACRRPGEPPRSVPSATASAGGEESLASAA